jgi:hypothetical protein
MRITMGHPTVSWLETHSDLIVALLDCCNATFWHKAVNTLFSVLNVSYLMLRGENKTDNFRVSHSKGTYMV